MVGVLRTILIILLVYYLIKWIGRLAMPFFIRKHFGNFNEMRQEDSRQEGEITIIKRGKKPEGHEDKLGEYVDFEEVDDE